ncbi:MAG: transposase [Bdellovibrio sp.]
MVPMFRNFAIEIDSRLNLKYVLYRWRRENSEKMRERFLAMKVRALEEWPKYPDKNKFQTALKYFHENYEGLTFFLGDAEVPIDNKLQERALRSPVVGRKTWYGTHSETGAKTGAILFTIVETCKLNHINPLEYLPKVVQDLHLDRKILAPWEF